LISAVMSFAVAQERGREKKPLVRRTPPAGDLAGDQKADAALKREALPFENDHVVLIFGKGRPLDFLSRRAPQIEDGDGDLFVGVFPKPGKVLASTRPGAGSSPMRRPCG